MVGDFLMLGEIRAIFIKILTFFIVGLLYYLENRGRQICEWNTKLILC